MAALNRKQRNICIAVTLFAIALVILIFVLPLKVFKPNQPSIAVDSVSLLDLNVFLDAESFAVDLNFTLVLNLSVENLNKMAFKYFDSTAVVSYRGVHVGEAPIPAGKLSAGAIGKMNLTLTFMADRILAKSELFSDVYSGEIPISTFVWLAGEVTVISVFDIRVSASSFCDLAVDVKNRSVKDQQCDYRTKL